MGSGRPRIPRTDSQRAETRRAQVRLNVQAFRQRQKWKQQELQHKTPGGTPNQKQSIASSRTSSPNSSGRQNYARSNDGYSEADYDDLEDETWSVQLPFRIDIGPAFKDAFIAALQYRSLPDNILPFTVQYDPNVRVAIGCSTWVSSACIDEGSSGMEILSDALLASAMNIISREKNDRDMALHGMHVHTKALHRLRRAFARYMVGEAEVGPTLLAMGALICSMSDLLANHSWDKFAAHLQGVGALIVHAGPGALNTTSARDHFYGYRSVQAAFCFTYRQATFLAKSEWINFPWKKQHAFASHPLHVLLDFAFQIPVEMEKFDRGLQNDPNVLRVQMHRLRKIAAKLDSWELNLKMSYNGHIYSKRPAIWSGLHTESFDFCNVSLATAFTFYTGVRVQLFNMIKAVSNQLGLQDDSAKSISDLASAECLNWSRSACQCFEFFYGGNKKILGKLTCLFPFDTAWETFVTHEKEGHDVARELDWCKTTALRVAEMGLPVLKWRSEEPESGNVEVWLT